MPSTVTIDTTIDTTIDNTIDTAIDSTPDTFEPKAPAMSTTLIDTAPASPDTDTDTAAPAIPRVTIGRVFSSEWLKFRSVRSNVIALASAGVAAVGLGALFSSLAGSDDGPRRLAENALSLSLGGFQLSQLIVGILGVAIVAGEYQTGLIRTWFGAAPDRLRILFAKVGVFGGASFVVALVAAFAAFLAGQALLPDSSMALSITDDGVLQALVGTAFYAACIGVIGVGLGFILRSTAAGTGAVVGLLMIAPVLVNLLPGSLGDPIGKILPSNAANAMSGIESGTELLSAGWGLAALGAWVLTIVAAAAISLRHRDA